MHYELYLPFPPTVNNYYVKTQRGVFISQKGRKFRDEVLTSIIEQIGDSVPIGDKMLVEIILFPPDKRKRDVDNYNKALLDAITETGLWEDDSLIDQLFNYRGIVKKGGQAYIRITDAAPVIKDVKMLPMD
jgi:crossover junction endodeoxyribonuclease RusA